MINVIGLIGAICFAVCAIPEAYATYRRGRAQISNGLLWLWFLGELFTVIYIHGTSNDLILLLNYYFNLSCLLIIIKFKLFPRKK